MSAQKKSLIFSFFLHVTFLVFPLLWRTTKQPRPIESIDVALVIEPSPTLPEKNKKNRESTHKKAIASHQKNLRAKRKKLLQAKAKQLGEKARRKKKAQEEMLKKRAEARQKKEAAEAKRRSAEKTAKEKLLAGLIQGQIMDCWSISPALSQRAQDIVVVMALKIEKDGRIVSAETLENHSTASHPLFGEVEKTAHQAFQNPACRRLELPADMYDTWREVNVRFSPQDAS